MLKSSSEFFGFFVALYAAYCAQDAANDSMEVGESEVSTQARVLVRLVVASVTFAGCAAVVKGFNDYLFGNDQ
ncbi:hypothetical protein pEaSNUABM54_00105 [Erwinia phage pEa_SNUABM_54]|nr:hypothetical protein pEaSNUABM54_00105 [Erwinia phage pEa_SNUABM_54]